MQHDTAARPRSASTPERLSWAIPVVAGLVAFVVWGPTTRPMGDSASYRDAAVSLAEGWSTLTERTLAYPLVLWLSGSTRTETTALLLVQIVMHVTAVLVLVRLAARIGVPAWGRVALAVLLVMPAPMVKVAYAGSEALAELLVVLTLWCFDRWYERRDPGAAVALGLLCGALAWTRPTFQLVFLPVAAMAWLVARREPLTPAERPEEGADGEVGRTPARGAATRSAALIAGPALAIVLVLVVANGLRFDSWSSTPMFGWFLGSRTSTFVQELPRSREPVRTLLVEERDRRLLLGPGTDAENYQFGVRDELARATGLEGVELDTYMRDLNLELVTRHPLDYLDAVSRSAERYVQIDAEPAASGPGRLGGWLQNLLHYGLIVAFLVPAVTVPGLALRGEVPRRMGWVVGCGLAIAGYVMAVSCLVQTGSPRLRAPTDPLLVLAMVAGWTVLARGRRRTPVAEPA